MKRSGNIEPIHSSQIRTETALRTRYEVQSNSNPLSKDTDGDGFSDNIEVDIAGLDPLSYNRAPPAPEFTFNSGQETMSVFAGGKLTSLGRSSRSRRLTAAASSPDLVVSMEGNFSQVVSFTNGEWLVSQSAPSGTYHLNYKVNDSLNREFSKTQYIVITALDLAPPTITLSDPGLMRSQRWSLRKTFLHGIR